ncbi:MAG: zinc ribbon domain-containing protein [Bacillota bacterium]|nr:zinc ribbon domain-containing protein [Bacillota bacterium]
MAMKSFTRNLQDHSTEAGFQFEFLCDLCQDGYKSEFTESTTYKKRGLFKGISEGLSVGGSLLGGIGGLGSIGYGLGRGVEAIGDQYSGMSPEWHREHERAFEIAQNEAMNHFHRCQSCRKWVCDADFNEEEGLCVECAPRMDVEVAAARARKMKEDIEEKAKGTVVFKGDIESKAITCPQCGKPVSSGKFCGNCGAEVGMVVCQRCGAKNQPGTKFCSECGNKL